MADIFQEVRERVSAEDVARRYGLQFDRRGWALCPFHRDRHPSMSFRNGRYHCWVCDLQGDSIDLTGRLLGLDAMEAVEQLNQIFALNLPLHRKPTQAETQAARRRQEVAEAHRAFEAWRADFINQLNAAYRVAHMALIGIEAPKDMDKLSEAQITAIQYQPYAEYLSDTLSFGTPKEQAEIYRERGTVACWIEKVLNN